MGSSLAHNRSSISVMRSLLMTRPSRRSSTCLTHRARLIVVQSDAEGPIPDDLETLLILDEPCLGLDDMNRIGAILVHGY